MISCGVKIRAFGCGCVAVVTVVAVVTMVAAVSYFMEKLYRVSKTVINRG